MAYGLEIFRADGSLQLSTEDIAYLPVDSFVVDYNDNPSGTKSYPGVDPKGDLKALLQPTEYTTLRDEDRTSKNHDPGGRFYVSIDQANKQVSWSYDPPEIEGGGSYTQAIVFVFIGGG